MAGVYAFATPSVPGVVKIGAHEAKSKKNERLDEANASDTW